MACFYIGRFGIVKMLVLHKLIYNYYNYVIIAFSMKIIKGYFMNACKDTGKVNLR